MILYIIFLIYFLIFFQDTKVKVSFKNNSGLYININLSNNITKTNERLHINQA